MSSLELIASGEQVKTAAVAAGFKRNTREGSVGINAVPRHRPVTAEQMKLALGLLSAIRDLSTKTIVGDITPNTPEVRC